MSNDSAILLDRLRAARRAREGLGCLALPEFIEDWKTQSIVLHQLLVLGEAVKRLSPELPARHPQIPWRQMARLRDVIIHCYDTVDLETVWTVVTRDLRPFIGFLETIAPPENEP